jgi:hypothetical protein
LTPQESLKAAQALLAASTRLFDRFVSELEASQPSELAAARPKTPSNSSVRAQVGTTGNLMNVERNPQIVEMADTSIPDCKQKKERKLGLRSLCCF